MCQKGHEWLVGINRRTIGNGRGCPYCAGLKPVKGVNDLATTDPDIAKQWHPTLNGDITPHDVSRGSIKKYWWLGGCGHIWDASVSSRVKGSGCPYCKGRKPIKGVNDLATVNPVLAKEWDKERNGGLTPDMFLPYSRTKVWWLCSCGNSWETAIKNRSEGSGCPECSKMKKGGRDGRNKRQRC